MPDTVAVPPVLVVEEEKLQEAPKPAYPSKIEQVDMLLLENLMLKHQNCVMQEERLVADVKKSREVMKTIIADRDSLLATLKEKYGVDISKCQIMPDGTFTLFPGMRG